MPYPISRHLWTLIFILTVILTIGGFYRFGAFEALKQRSVDDRGNLSPQARVLCGLGAGVCEAILAVTPMETVKVKFINDQRSGNPRFKGFFHGVGLILKEQGIIFLYIFKVNNFKSI